MNKKIISILTIIFLVFVNNASLVMADSRLQFKGEIKQVNKFYDGDCISADDFIVNGYFVDENGNTVDIQNSKIRFDESVNLNTSEVTYIVFDNDNKTRAFGKTNVEVLPFNSNVNYETINIKPFTYDIGIGVEYCHIHAESYIAKEIKKCIFKNNIGKKLVTDDSTWAFDISKLGNTVGKYEISYSVKFYSNNFKYQYDTLTGKVEVDIVKNITSPTSTPTINTETSLTAETINLTSIGLTYDINVNNKPENATYSFSSSDTSVVTVNPTSGLVKAIAKGSSTITCKETLADGTTNTYTVKVTVGTVDGNPVLSDTSLDLSVDETFDLNAENRIAGSSYKYKSTDTDIVTVKSYTGYGLAVSNGTANIILTAITPNKNVYVLKCTVNVN